MCLTKVSKRKPKASGYEWKWFRAVEPEFVQTPLWCTTLRIGDWVAATVGYPIWIRTNCYIYYTSGFHIYTRKGDALRSGWANNMMLHRVQYRKAHTAGWGDGMYLDKAPQVIAGEMRVLPLPRRKGK